MIRRWLARFCLLAAAMSVARLSNAGVWGTQPVLGISGDYDTNPALLNLPDTAETHAALLLDAPTTYVGNAFKLTILPSFRLSNSQGYSSLDSDYEHLNVSGEFDSERGALTVTGAVARDSSLYHDYLLSGSSGVRRDTATADVNWDRQLTERLEFDGDLNSTRVRYDESTGIATLVDYKYSSINPTLAWLQSERGKLTVTAGAGRYNSLDGMTESTNATLQLGFVRSISGIWSISASAGYSRADDRFDLTEEALEFTQNGPIIVLIPVNLKSRQNGSVYNINVSRQTELLLLSATASRQLAATGFAFLSSQDAYDLKAVYTPSPRWTLNADTRRVSYQQPEGSNRAEINLNIISLQLSAAWQWTEHWTVTMNATRVMEHYVSPIIDLAATGVSVEVSRQFNWKSFQ